jgi:D-serine deaminase-like pyridoxal phosphate-dependent protein
MESEFQIPNLPPPEDYRFTGVENVMTPALVIYPEYVDSNIRETIRLLGGQPDRWRPHVKTSKLAFVMERFVDHGVTTFKCSTTLELLTICGAGAADVLVAYPITGPAARRVREIAAMYPEIRVSVLVESPQQVQQWAGSGIGVFIDVNPGMDRTGIPQANADVIINLVEFVSRQGIPFRGLHYYDGHLSMPDLAERQAAAHKGYDGLLPIIDELERRDLGFGELITAGTPAFPCTASYGGFARRRFLHRASPGTVVYADCSSLNSLPKEYGYRPAAVVMSTVVSRPSSSIVTCDAGHKTVSADAGVPTCAILGYPHLRPLKPSEEHLPVEVSDGAKTPEIGDNLFLVPRHICPTVNNFDCAVIVSNGRIVGVENVTARGREAPLGL